MAGERGFGTGLKALVVDDDSAIRHLLQTLLRSVAFNVETADSVEHAKERFQSSRFDLVLADKNLPDGSGLGLARHIREKSADTEVVAMSAYASVDSAVEAMQLDVADYLVKPFHREDVLGRLRRVVEVQALKRRNQELLNELQEKNRALEGLVVRDPLTEMYNHAFFQERLENELAASKRHDRPFSLLFIDLDAFKKINDAHGHPVGDEVLKSVAAVMKGQGGPKIDFRLRSQDIAARYGGDEFVMILPETPKSGGATKAQQLRGAVERCNFGPALPPQTVSIGVAAYPTDGNTRDELIHAADAALYAAKAMGKNTVVSYTHGLVTLGSGTTPEQSLGARQLMGLERSIANRAFRFLYQPIVRSQTYEVYAYEGLCRPTDEAFASAVDIIACAERSGRMWELGRVLREMVVAPIADLPDPCLMFVNLHPYELHDQALLSVEKFLAPWAKRVVFEITEAGAIRDYVRLAHALAGLRAAGFKIALDDLGAGYSGLNALAQLEPDFVKLDMGLLQGIQSDSRSSRLVKHILDFAAGEGIQVVAEGIETDAERTVVTGMGCPLLQGYFFSRPEPPFVKVAPAQSSP